jgi:NitT/TauT family transport system permease protein
MSTSLEKDPMHATGNIPAESVGAATQRSTRDRKRKRRASLYAWRLFVLAVWLIAWQVAGEAWLGTQWTSTPMDVVERLRELLVSGELLTHTWITVLEATLGLIVGTVLGIVFGIVLGRSAAVRQVLDPYIMGLYSLPRVALAPLLILWFGIGLTSKVVLAVSIVGFVVLFNVIQGIASIDDDLVDGYKTMRASRLEIYRKVVIPSLTPWFLSSIRIGIGMALIAAVVGEMIGSSQGLGWYVAKSARLFDVTGVMAGLVVLGIIAIILNSCVVVAERKLLKWKGDESLGRNATVKM